MTGPATPPPDPREELARARARLRLAATAPPDPLPLPTLLGSLLLGLLAGRRGVVPTVRTLLGGRRWKRW